MRFAITIQAQEEAAAGAMLLQVAVALRQQRIQPDSLFLHAMTGEPTVTIWLLVARDAEKAGSLVEYFRDMPEAKEVEILPWDEKFALPTAAYLRPGGGPSITD